MGLRMLTQEERSDILSLWAGLVSVVAIYFLIGSFWKAVLIGAFVGGSAALGYGTRWLLKGSFAFAVLAIAVALGIPPARRPLRRAGTCHNFLSWVLRCRNRSSSRTSPLTGSTRARSPRPNAAAAKACTHESRLFGNRWLPQTSCEGCRRKHKQLLLPPPFSFLDYIEFIGAKKHLVLGLLSHTDPERSNSVAIG